MQKKLSYEQSGVNIDTADAAKREMAESLKTNDPRVLNTLGAFATLYDASFPEYTHPVLVLKSEEPGSKQKLAFKYNSVTSICYDLINHLIDDIIVMGAKPLSVQDTIICGKLEKDVVSELVRSMAAACREQECTLTGGETSEQPGVVDAGLYILTATIVGVVEKSKVIDGSKIRPGDTVLAIASNGLHTNGYSLVRALMESKPEIIDMKVNGTPFIDTILKPHTCYYKPLRKLFDNPALHGLAHITGGGIRDNLRRVLPEGCNAAINADAIRILPVFSFIREHGGVDDPDMMRTFNLGVGMTAVCDPSAADDIQAHVRQAGLDCYPIGEITAGERQVVYRGELKW